MRKVGIKTLKNELSAYIRAVAAGETVLVTDRGEVVAELVPPRPAEKVPATPEEQWAELIRLGHVTPAKTSFKEPPPRAEKGTMTLEELMRELDEDRSDR